MNRCISVLCAVLVILPWTNCQDTLSGHSISYQQGHYSVDNTVIIDANSEYILSFPNTSTLNPYRITVHAPSWARFPVLIVIRQEKQVLSWQIPMVVSTSAGHLQFANTSRTLCFSSREMLRQLTGKDTQTARNFSVSISTSSPAALSVTVRADEVLDYFIQKDKMYSAMISPSEPVFYFYDFPEKDSAEISTVFIEIDSEDDVCLIVSVQESMCPVRDLNKDIKFEGDFQTVNKKGGLIVSSRLFPDGFFLVFVAQGDNFECNQESSILPMPRSRKRLIRPQNRTSLIEFSIRSSIGEAEYIAATMAILGANLGFCLLFITIVVVGYYCTRHNDFSSDENSDDEDVVDSKPKADTVDHYLENEDPTLQDFIIKSSVIQKKSFNYFWHITNIGIFYGIPVVQLMVAYQRIVNRTGDLDTCYRNFLCAHPLVDLDDFNHIYSNIGYILLGILFLFITLFKHMKHKHYPGCGIPKHYGIFYAMGVALILEGILSACYHICPNQSNYQFDTSFMYVMAVLCMIKLYQNRHPRINASAYATFTILGAAVFLAMVGILTNSTAIMVIFVISYLALCIFLSFKIYFMGFIINGVKKQITVMRNGLSVIEAVSPIRKGRFILLFMANVCNVVMAIVGIIFYPSYTDFGTYLLGILMANSVLHASFYICMKLFHKERICIAAIFYILLSLLTWGASCYFFLNSATLWTVTPAESRQMNRDCIFMEFYDDHDIWHLLSAPALFFTFMMLMHLDDDLAHVPRSEIAAF